MAGGNTVPPNGSILEQDPQTRATVQLLQDAWGAEQVQAPNASGLKVCEERLEKSGLLETPRTSRRVLSWPVWIPVAAALLLWFLFPTSPGDSRPDDSSSTELAQANQPEVTQGSQQTTETSSPESAPQGMQEIPTDATSVPLTADVPAIHLRKDGVELHSGVVRLLVLDPAPREPSQQ